MANSIEVARLVATIEAKTTQYERALKRVEGRTTKLERTTGRSMRKITLHMRGATSAARRMFQVFGIGLAVGGVTGLVGSLRDISRSIAQIRDEAQTAGVALREFQEFQFVAGQLRISQDALVDGFKELNLRAEEFVVTGKGAAAEAFERLGFSAEDLGARLGDIPALFTEIIRRTEDLDRASQIRISDEIFGGQGGEQFVRVMRAGAASLDAMRQSASDLGHVVDESGIQRMVEFEQVVDRVSRAVERFKVNVTLRLVKAFDAIAYRIDQFMDRPSVKAFLNILGISPTGPDGGLGLTFSNPFSGGPPQTSGAPLEVTGGPGNSVLGARADFKAREDALDVAKEKVAALKKETADAARAAERFSDVFSSGLSDLALRGAKLEDVLGRIVNQLADQAIQALVGQLFSSGGGGEKAGGGIFGGLFSGAFAGGGGGEAPASILPPNFAGLFASGGTIPAGSFGVVGEAGPELVSGPAHITPMGSGGGHLVVETVARVDSAGNIKAFVERVSGRVAGQVVRYAAPGIVQQSSAASGGALSGGDYDGAMARFGVSPVAPAR